MEHETREGPTNVGQKTGNGEAMVIANVVVAGTVEVLTVETTR